VEFGILGALEVRVGGAPVALGGPRERALLAVLLLNANELVPTDRLVDELWGEEPPRAAVKTVQVYVSRWRKVLGADAIVTSPAGYRLRVDPDRFDLLRFERLARAGREALTAGDAATAGKRLGEALSLWRGAPLADFAYEPFAQAEVARLEEMRLVAVEDRIEADLRCGRAIELVGELRGLTARHPLRERLRRQLMLALYRSDRQAEALDVYRDTRATLVEELGIEPSRDLQDLERAILGQDPSLRRPGARLAPRAAGAFVGRDAELAALVGALGDAEAGRGGVFLLSGEPGIGKSRLADEVAARARDRGLRVLRGRCWEAGGAPGYWPWVQALRSYVRGADPDLLRVRLGRGAPELAEMLPELREVLDLPRPAVHDPEALRFRLFDAIAAFLHGLGNERGLVVVLDDLHAADEPSLLLLEFLAQNLADARVLVLGAYRDTETAPGDPLGRVIGGLVKEPMVGRVALDGLGRTDVSEYVELSAGRRAPESVIDAIHQSTAGNPLFVAETVRLLASEGRLDRVDAPTVVPAGVREAIDRRLQRLSEDARAVLTVASVLGREFDPRVLQRLRPGEVDALDEAIAARLVTAAPGAPGMLRFAHALVRDALYEAIPASDRRELHGRVAEELERRHVAEPGPYLAKLALHFFEAASAESAIEYARLGAERAAAQLAYEEAARLYRLALRALELSDAADESRLCDLLLGLGDAQARAGDDADAKETFLRAAEVARRAQLAERLGRAALGYGGRWVWMTMRGDPHIIPLLEEAIVGLPDEDSELRARLLARLAGGPLKVGGDATRPRRFELSAQAVAMARRLGDALVLAWTLDGRKVAIWGPDTLEEHWAVIEELCQLAEQAGDLEQLVDAHICRLIKLFERFELSRFATEYGRAAKAAEELRQPGQRWLVEVMAPMHALLVGRLADAERLIEQAYELGRKPAPWDAHICSLLQRFVLQGLEGRVASVEQELSSAAADYPYYPVLQAALASLYAELGDRAACRAAFEVLAPDDFAGLPHDMEWLLAMGLLADACAFLEDTERAGILFEQLEPYGHRILVGPLEVAIGSAGRPLGKLAATLGHTEQATRWFERATAENERAGALPWAAHTRLDHAQMLIAHGNHTGAEPLLAQAEATYRALGMDAWAARSEIPAPSV
jgi:DNA-binding SARP family transcriptional activator